MRSEPERTWCCFFFFFFLKTFFFFLSLTSKHALAVLVVWCSIGLTLWPLHLRRNKKQTPPTAISVERRAWRWYGCALFGQRRSVVCAAQRSCPSSFFLFFFPFFEGGVARRRRRRQVKWGGGKGLLFFLPSLFLVRVGLDWRYRSRFGLLLNPSRGPHDLLGGGCLLYRLGVPSSDLDSFIFLSLPFRAGRIRHRETTLQSLRSSLLTTLHNNNPHSLALVITFSLKMKLFLLAVRNRWMDQSGLRLAGRTWTVDGPGWFFTGGGCVRMGRSNRQIAKLYLKKKRARGRGEKSGKRGRVHLFGF